jgi:8-oxo-dGTP diphosphatase
VPQENETWKLPGGYIAANEDLDTCARRHLYDQTGLKDIYLEQLYTFGCPHRAPQQPTISVTYFALVPPESLKRCAQCPDNRLLRWFSIHNLPLLLLHQADVIAMAYKRLAAKLNYSTIALQLMPKQFTLRALQSVYETILEASLDKRNFRKRMLAMNCIEATNGTLRQGKHRPARLYRVKTPGKVEFIR